MKVAVIQMDVTLANPLDNERRVIELMHQAVSNDIDKPDLLMLPEMWNTGYALDRLEQLADGEGERTCAIISAFARDQHVHVIAGSVAVRTSDGAFANRAFVFDASGACVATYDKLHLFRLMQEEQFLTQGQAHGQFSLDGITAGMMICYDIRFPELARKLALAGARVLFVPAQWPNPRLHHWRTLLQARAIENQMYVVACNRVGESAGTSFFGHSLIIDPWGEVIAEGTDEQQILTATLDFALVEDVRRRIPVFADRRPEMY